MSDLVSVAINEFLTKYFAEKQQSGRIAHKPKKEGNEESRTKTRIILKEGTEDDELT